MTDTEYLEQIRQLNEKVVRLELDLAFEETDRKLGHITFFILGAILGILGTTLALIPNLC